MRKIKERPSFGSWLSDYIERSEQMWLISLKEAIKSPDDFVISFWSLAFYFMVAGLWLTFTLVLDWIMPPMAACGGGMLLVGILTVYLYYLLDTTKLKRG